MKIIKGLVGCFRVVKWSILMFVKIQVFLSTFIT